MGANLTLVEPNPLAVERLLELFSSFKLQNRLMEVVQDGIEGFETQSTYDIVVAEGFLNTLDNRDQMLGKTCRLIIPGGLGVISFDERAGHLLELTRKLLFRRVCRLEGLEEVRSADSLALAKRLFFEDISQLNASRPFEGWYDDELLNPLQVPQHFWSYRDILPLLEAEGCEFHSSSPAWCSVDRFDWYKNVLSNKDRHQKLLEEWLEVFSFFITGLPRVQGDAVSPTLEVVDSVLELNLDISKYIQDPGVPILSVSYPEVLDDYLSHSIDTKLRRFNEELKSVILATKSNVAADLITAYERATTLKNLWGAPYHYVCIRKVA